MGRRGRCIWIRLRVGKRAHWGPQRRRILFLPLGEYGEGGKQSFWFPLRFPCKEKPWQYVPCAMSCGIHMHGAHQGVLGIKIQKR
jgi:hypothetical protein